MDCSSEQAQGSPGAETTRAAAVQSTGDSMRSAGQQEQRATGPEATKPVSVRLPGDQLRSVEAAAERQGLSLGQYLRKAGCEAATRELGRPRRRRQLRARARARVVERAKTQAALAAELRNVVRTIQNAASDEVLDADSDKGWWTDPLSACAFMFGAALSGAVVAAGLISIAQQLL